jgi:radical SAM protein with 4Fe4S-binding SPASM domain
MHEVRARQRFTFAMKPTLKKSMIAAGIIAGKAFTGPMEVAVDITNRCTMGCISCWNYSPLLDNPPSGEWKSVQMDIERFSELTIFMKQAGVRKVGIGGNGDPFMHPQIVEILKLSKSTGAFVSVSTKGAYFQQATLQSLVEMNLDELVISLFAASKPVFSAMHPKTSPQVFDRIVDSLRHLARLRTGQFPKPFLVLLFVVCKYNYQEIDSFVDLAREVGADMITFKRVAVVPNTRGLLLDGNDFEILKEKLTAVEEKSKKYGIPTNMDEFRITTLSGLRDGVYSKNLYQKIPCCVGFTYSRIEVDGNVAPCCGCLEWSMGNLNEKHFKEIWQGREYSRFRAISKKITQYDGVVRGCGCETCVHSSANLGIYKKLHPIRARRLLKEL